MKIVKGVLVYSLIALGIVIGIGILLMGIMFLIPSFKVFGYGFIYKTKGGTMQTYRFSENIENYYEMENIVLEFNATEGINVHVTADNENSRAAITSTLYYSYYGFYKDSSLITQSAQDVSYNSGTKTLTYKVNAYGLNGAINYSDKCYLDVVIPRRRIKSNGTADDAALSYTMNIHTVNGDIIIKGSGTDENFIGAIQVNNMSISTQKGDLSLYGVGSNVTGNTKPTKLEMNEFNISTQYGTFNFAGISQVTANGNVVFNSKRGDFLFDKLTVNGDFEITGDNVLFKANNLTVEGDLNYQTTNGAFKVANKIKSNSGQLSIVSNTTEVVLGTVEKGALGITTEYGNVTISDSQVNTLIIGGHGNVNVAACSGGLEARTSYGNINATYSKGALLVSNRGIITANSTNSTDADAKSIKTIVNLEGKAILNLTTKQLPFEINCGNNNCTVNITVQAVITNLGTGYVTSTVNMGKGTLNFTAINTYPFVVSATGGVSGRIGTYTIPGNGTRTGIAIEGDPAVNTYQEYELVAPKINFSTYM